jgi:AcrR family transcriptional regulator
MPTRDGDGRADASRGAGAAGRRGWRRSKLSRDVVFSAALELIDRDGIEHLSMRGLGQALGRDPMTIYKYTPNKAAILDGVTEVMLSQLAPSNGKKPGDWREELRKIARQFREIALAHPNAVALIVTRPLSSPLARRPPGTLRPLEYILELLAGAGISGRDALFVYRSLFGFLVGHILNELQEVIEEPEEDDDLLRLGLQKLPLREFPRLRSLASALISYDGAAELERGLDLLITGLSTQLTPPPEKT